MKRALTLAALATAGLVAQAATVTSTFDTDNEGWTTLNNGGFVPTWIAADGLIRSEDIVEGWAYLAAPAAFLSAADYGALFSFDLSTTSTTREGLPALAVYGVRVALVGAAGTLIAQAATPPLPVPGAFSFSFDIATDWRLTSGDPADFPTGAPVATQSQIEAVLGSLSGLYVSADHTDFNTQVGGTDVTNLDNVSLVTADIGVVPEPASAALVLAALAGLQRSRRRR